MWSYGQHAEYRMSDARKNEIQRLFHAALDQPEGDRIAFVERACGDCSGKRPEVISAHLGTEGLEAIHQCGRKRDGETA